MKILIVIWKVPVFLFYELKARQLTWIYYQDSMGKINNNAIQNTIVNYFVLQ